MYLLSYQDTNFWIFSQLQLLHFYSRTCRFWSDLPQYTFGRKFSLGIFFCAFSSCTHWKPSSPRMASLLKDILMFLWRALKIFVNKMIGYSAHISIHKMNGRHLSRVTSLGIYLTLWIFSIYLVLQVPQFAVLKLTIINKNAKPGKNHTEVCKCNAPNMYIQFIQLKRYKHFLRVEDTVSLWLHIADLLSLQQLLEVIMFIKNLVTRTKWNISMYSREMEWIWCIQFKDRPSKHLLVLKTSWRRLQDMFWRRLQYVFSVTISRLPRRLEDVLQRCFEDVLKTSCKTSWKRLQDILKTSWKTKNCYESKSDNSKANLKCINYRWLVWCYEISLIHKFDIAENVRQ